MTNMVDGVIIIVLKMPVRKVGNKYAIGKGKAMYKSKASAERAYRAYLAKKHDSKRKKK